MRLKSGWCGLAAAVALTLSAAAAVDRFVDQLAGSDREQRREGSYQLSLMGAAARPALNSLIKALDDPDRQVWANAVTAISNIGPDAADAIPKLIEGIDSRSAKGFRPRDKAQTIFRSAYALAQIGDPAKPALLAALKGDDTGLRIGAAKAFGMMGKKGAAAVPGLIENLASEDGEVRDECVEALGAIGQSAVAPLTASLAHEKAQVRASSVQAIGLLGLEAQSAGPAVLKLAADEPNREIRAAALVALPKLGLPQERVVPPLIAAVKDPDADINRAAVDGLLLVRPAGKAVVPALLALLREPAFAERAAKIVGRFGREAREAVPPLLTLAGKAQSPDSVFVQAIVAIGGAAVPAVLAEVAKLPTVSADHWTVNILGGIGGAGLPELQTALSAKQPNVRAAALFAIQRIGLDARETRAAVTKLASDPEPAVRAAALPALVAVGVKPPEIYEPIEAALADSAPAVRLAAATAAGQLTDKARPLAGKIAGLLNDKETSVQLAAVEALGRIGGGGEWVETLVARLDDPKLRLATIESVARLQPPGATPKLVALYPKSDRVARLAILEAVAGSGEEANAVIEAAAQDSDSTVRAAGLRARARNRPNLETFVPLLVAALGDADPQLRQAAAEAAASLGEKEADRLVSLAEPLIAMAANESDRTLALDTLRAIRLRNPEMILLGLESPAVEVRVWAIEQLGRLGGRARPFRARLEPFLNDSDDYVRRASSRALRSIGR